MRPCRALAGDLALAKLALLTASAPYQVDDVAASTGRDCDDDTALIDSRRGPV